MRLSLRADVGVGAIAVSPTSRDVVLAGRSGLYVIDLLDPFALPRWLPLRNAWEVSSVQWCPDPARPSWVVSTSNQKVLVWNLEFSSDRAIEHVLQGHRRAVTDVTFSPFRPDELASASIDTTIRLWDLRDPRASHMQFADFSAGAIQVKFSRTNEHQLASTHNNRAVVWDRRFANRPVANLRAHIGECNGLEFLASGKVLTCSTDRTIKMWDLTEPSQPELDIVCDFPVWRTIPTPYELGALVVPLRGSNNAVRIVNLARNTGTTDIADITVKDSLFHHPEPVKSALFMRTDFSPTHYDVVTWSKDSHLREWKGGALANLPHASSAAGCKDDAPPSLPKETQTFNTNAFDTAATSAVYNHRRGVFDIPIFNRRKEQTHGITHLDWISGIRVDQEEQESPESTDEPRGRRATSSEEVSQEIVALSMRFPRVHFEDINIWAGSCLVQLNGPWGADGDVVAVSARVHVPPEYPFEPMKCILEPSEEIGSKASEINTFLESSCAELSRHGIRALEFCVRYLVGDPVSIEDALASEHPMEASFAELDRTTTLETAIGDSSDTDDTTEFDVDFGDFDESNEAKQFDDGNLAGQRREEAVNVESNVIDSTPVPKSCGAVWSNTGKLVCFFNQKTTIKERGPLPLDKIFADDSSNASSEAPFASDNDDFDIQNPDNTWSAAAARLTSRNETGGGSNGGAARIQSNGRSIMNFTASLNHFSNLIPPKNVRSQPSESHQTHSEAGAPPYKIVVKDFSHLMPCRPDLAEEYNMSVYGLPLEMAEHNAEVALRHGRIDDEHIWRLLINYVRYEETKACDPMTAMLAEVPKCDWAGGVTGFQHLLPQIAKELERRGNVQMLVGLSSVLSALRSRRQHLSSEVAAIRPMGDDYTLLEPSVETLYQLNNDGTVTSVARRMKQEPWFDNLSPSASSDTLNDSRVHHRNQRFSNASTDSSHTMGPLVSMEVLDDAMFEYQPQPLNVYSHALTSALEEFRKYYPRLVAYRVQYARLLHVWGLDLKRAEVLKANMDDPLVRNYDDHSWALSEIEGDASGIVEMRYRACALCETPIIKTFEFCPFCSHAMHSKCAQVWWEAENNCPAACGCSCKEHTFTE